MAGTSVPDTAVPPVRAGSRPTGSLGPTAAYLVFAAAALVYVNTLWGEFVYDDFPFIVHNPAVHTLARPWKFLLERAAMSEGGFYTIFRPLSGWLFSLTWAAAGETPAAFHFVNLLAHGLASVCVWRLAVTLGLGERRGALWAGLVFAVHPVHTEAVAWIAGLANPCFTIGVTCGCVAWLHWRKASASPAALAAAFAWYAVGLLAKEHAVALPLLVVGLEWALGGTGARPLGQRLAALLGLAVLTVGYVWWRDRVLGQTGQVAHLGGSFGATMLTMTIGVRTYLRLLLFPTNLHPEYIIPAARSLSAPGVLPSILVLLGVAGAGVAARRRWPLVAAGVAWFFLALAPVSNVIPMKTVINERLLYLPLIGFAVVLGVVWERTTRRPVRALLVAQFVAFATLAIVRNADWRTSERLWSSAVASEPRGYTSHFNLGEVLRQQGDTEGALLQFRQAIALRGRFPHAHGAVGMTYLERGEPYEAVAAFRRGLQEAPVDAHLRAGLAEALVRWGDTARAAGRRATAEGAYREALALAPQHAGARAGLAALTPGAKDSDV